MNRSPFKSLFLILLSLLTWLLFSETAPGGRYLVGGRLVDANGKPIIEPEVETDEADGSDGKPATPKTNEPKAK